MYLEDLALKGIFGNTSLHPGLRPKAPFLTPLQHMGTHYRAVD